MPHKHEQRDITSNAATNVKQLKHTIRMWKKTVKAGTHEWSNETIKERIYFLETIKLPEAVHIYENELAALRSMG